MTWLAPWALGAGALGIAGIVLAHLLSRQRPRALSLATARFLPSGMLEATTLQKTPRDRWWLLLRVLLLALLAAGAAQPVMTGSRVDERTVLLLDRSLPVDVQRRAVASVQPTDAVIAFDTTATLTTAATVAYSAQRDASLSTALARLVRARDSLSRGATRLRIRIASRFTAASLDPATETLRGLLPDSISVLPVTVATDSVVPRGTVVTNASGDDAIAATAALLGDSVAPAGALIERGAAVTHDDSAAAERGATVVWWPARTAEATTALRGLTVARTTWVAPFAPDTGIATVRGGRVIGRWADGAPAVWSADIGRGCLVTVGAALPAAGDHTLSLSAQAWLAAVLTSCDHDGTASGAAPSWLVAPAATRAAAVVPPVLHSSLAPWLALGALMLGVLELVLRAVRHV